MRGDGTVKPRTVLFMFCLIGTPAWAPAEGDLDAKPIDPDANARVQEEIAQRSDVVGPPPKLICRRETPTGSHRRITICRTVRQIEDGRDGAETLMEDSRGGSAYVPVNP